jgi:hypothetical protein
MNPSSRGRQRPHRILGRRPYRRHGKRKGRSRRPGPPARQAPDDDLGPTRRDHSSQAAATLLTRPVHPSHRLCAPSKEPPDTRVTPRARKGRSLSIQPIEARRVDVWGGAVGWGGAVSRHRSPWEWGQTRAPQLHSGYVSHPSTRASQLRLTEGPHPASEPQTSPAERGPHPAREPQTSPAERAYSR